MNEQEYRELEPLYDQAKREVPLMDVISISRAQRVYPLGYNRAARLLEQLALAGVLSYDNSTASIEQLSPWTMLCAEPRLHRSIHQHRMVGS